MNNFSKKIISMFEFHFDDIFSTIAENRQRNTDAQREYVEKVDEMLIG